MVEHFGSGNCYLLSGGVLLSLSLFSIVKFHYRFFSLLSTCMLNISNTEVVPVPEYY